MTALMLVLFALALPAVAEEAVPVQLGGTGLYLPNNAMSQDKHYLKQDEDLMGRVACLLQDMDGLLVELHALPPERAGTPETQPPTADELPMLIALALEHNPSLEPLRSQLAIKGAKARQAGAKPDPMAIVGVAGLPLPQAELADIPMTMVNFGWSQRFISYGKRGLKREIASLDADITELGISSEELELIDTISLQYFGLLSLQARIDTQQQSLELLELLLALAERKYALGLTPQGQVVRAQAKLTEMEQQQYALEQQLARQQEVLYGALGRPAGFDPASLQLHADYTVPQAVSLDQPALLAEMLKRRPDMQSYWMQQRQQDLKLELAAREYRPDYTISAQYGLRWGMRDLLAFNVAVPVFTHKAERQDAAVQEQAARADMLNQQQAALENELATQLGLLQLDLERIAELSTRYRTALVPQARLALDALIAGYAANQTGLDELLLAQGELLAYELELQQLSIDYLATLTQLQISTGGAFDPAPYLTSDETMAQLANAIPGTLPDSVEVRLAEEEQSQLNSLFITPPTDGQSLVDSLSLPPAPREPEAMQLARLATQQATELHTQAARLLLTGVNGQVALGGTTAGATAGPVVADFYSPFTTEATASEEQAFE